jgi:hypothetical protein
MGITGADDCYPNFDFGLQNQQIIEAMEQSIQQDGWTAVE